MILYGKIIAEKLKEELKEKAKQCFPEKKHYLAILFFGDNSSSKVYVKNKIKYGESINIPTKVFGQEEDKERKIGDIVNLIQKLNKDEYCVGIILQLPLPESMEKYKKDLLGMIEPEKDVDGLSGSLVGKSFFNMVSFTPATPKAVMFLLDYYNLGNLKNKRCAIIGQSTIVGKPLAIELLKRGAQIACFDINNTQDEIKNYTKTAEYIFSATGQTHLIDDSYVTPGMNQIIIDIGYGHLEGKAVGDVCFEKVQDKVLHITPVPGGIGPLTIASLFSNIFDLWEQFN